MRTTRTALVVAALLASACGRDLSRSQAAELIKKQSPPVPYLLEIHLGTRVPVPLSPAGAFATAIPFNSKGTNYANGEALALPEYNRLARAGLLTMSNAGGFVPMFYGDTTYYSILPTQEGTRVVNQGKPVVFGTSDVKTTLKMCDLVFGEVTGITQDGDKTRASATFTVVLDQPTAAFKALGWNDKYTFTRTATFVRFDDGWRLLMTR